MQDGKKRQKSEDSDGTWRIKAGTELCLPARAATGTSEVLFQPVVDPEIL